MCYFYINTSYIFPHLGEENVGRTYENSGGWGL